jgi:hypothetical protein
MDGASIVGKRSSLSDFTVEKPGVVKPPMAKAGDPRRGQTLRLNPEAWTQLKVLAAEQRATSHVLLVEAVNDLFRKHGKPPIA